MPQPRRLSPLWPALAVAAAALLGALILTGSAAAAPGGPSPCAGGAPATDGDYPFVTGIRRVSSATGNFFCTGTLVDPQWVLTAAHCVDAGTAATDLQAVVGETDLDDGTEPGRIHSVDRIEIHPRWGGDAGDSHDVAMIHLATPSSAQVVYFGVPGYLKSVLKRCRQMQGFTAFPFNCPIKVGTGIGWGRTPSSGDATSRRLIEAPATIYAHGMKKTFWTTKTGACPGDSGGPLLVPNGHGGMIQIGVASYIKHGGGWFDWLYGGQCSRRSMDYYSDVSGGELLTWFERFLP